MTVHQAKGKEFDAVVIADAFNRFYRDDEESRNVFYVALTRATKSWTVIAPDHDNQASPLLRHPPVARTLVVALRGRLCRLRWASGARGWTPRRRRLWPGPPSALFALRRRRRGWTRWHFALGRPWMTVSHCLLASVAVIPTPAR